jgi:hypothetical protein
MQAPKMMAVDRMVVVVADQTPKDPRPMERPLMVVLLRKRSNPLLKMVATTVETVVDAAEEAHAVVAKTTTTVEVAITKAVVAVATVVVTVETVAARAAEVDVVMEDVVAVAATRVLPTRMLDLTTRSVTIRA